MSTHADASPSSASIWINCPASVTKARGRKRVPTVYTAEGSAAHEVAERLIHGLPAPSEVTIDGFTFPVDDDMVEAVEVFCGYAGALKQKADVFLTETQVNVPTFGGEKLYGTADVIAYTKAIENIEIVDLKYGRGVAVSAANNPQLRIYALGAIDSLGGAYPISEIRMTIVQPRTGGGAIGLNSEMIDTYTLYAWRDTILLPALARIGLDDQTETPGAHCRWCVRAGECRALANLSQKSAAMVFDDKTGTPDLKHLTSLSDDELAAILDQADMVVGWVERVRAEASHRIDLGGKIPGWKLAAKRAMEKWIDADEALAEVNNLFPHVDGLLKLRTPAQVKKTLKAAKEDPGSVAAYITKESSGTTLVPEEDPRPAVKTDAKSVFEQLTSSLEIDG